MILRLAIILISTLLFGACSPSQSTTPPQSGEVSIAYLKSLCEGSQYYIASNYSIRGTIVANDWFGELNKKAIVADSSGSLEFTIESINIKEKIPLYSEVEISCNGLMLARIGSNIVLGVPSNGDFPLDNITDETFNRYISREGINENFTIESKCFSEIGAEDIGNIVRFDNVRICDEEQGRKWCDFEEEGPITTYRTIVNSEGESFAVRTLPTCHYADEEMPSNEISVIGVIDYSDNRYFIRIVNKSFA